MGVLLLDEKLTEPREGDMNLAVGAGLNTQLKHSISNMLILLPSAETL